jgi:hypothetical protein
LPEGDDVDNDDDDDDDIDFYHILITPRHTDR